MDAEQKDHIRSLLLEFSGTFPDLSGKTSLVQREIRPTHLAIDVQITRLCEAEGNGGVWENESNG